MLNNNQPLTYEDKKRINTFLCSEEGELLIKAISDIQEEALSIAQTAYLKLPTPSEQITAQVHRASGVRSVLEFLDFIKKEVKEKEGK